jgi:restriction system protein
VVIELKRDPSDDEVVGQLSRYMGWIKERRAAPTGVSVRGIIVVHEVTPKLRAAALAHENVQLYTYSLSIALYPVVLPGRNQTDPVTC